MRIVLTTIFAGKHRFISAESLKTEIKYNVYIDCNYNNDKNWNSINLEYILFLYMDIRLIKSFCAFFDVAFIYTVTLYTPGDSRYIITSLSIQHYCPLCHLLSRLFASDYMNIKLTQAYYVYNVFMNIQR